MLRRRWQGWQPRVLTCSSHQPTDIAKVLAVVRDFQATVRASGRLERMRSEQEFGLLLASVQGELAFRLRADPQIRAMLQEQHRLIVDEHVPPRVAADTLCRRFVERMRSA
jgi:LAO/AO transport system kinase